MLPSFSLPVWSLNIDQQCYLLAALNTLIVAVGGMRFILGIPATRGSFIAELQSFLRGWLAGEFPGLGYFTRVLTPAAYKAAYFGFGTDYVAGTTGGPGPGAMVHQVDVPLTVLLHLFRVDYHALHNGGRQFKVGCVCPSCRVVDSGALSGRCCERGPR